MNEEAIVVLVVLPLLLMFLAAPIIAMVMTFRLRSEQKRQAEVLNLLLERSHAARVTESAPAIQPARSPAAPALAPMPALASAPEVTPPPPPAAIPATEAAPLLPPPLPPPPPPPPAAREPGPLESKARALLGRIWNWVIIGEEFRSPGTSWEFALATNWLLRLGIVAVVIGIGFFLKFSIERGLLGPQARVALSVLTGLGMLVGGVRLVGRPYQLLGQVLIGGYALRNLVMKQRCAFVTRPRAAIALHDESANRAGLQRNQPVERLLFGDIVRVGTASHRQL